MAIIEITPLSVAKVQPALTVPSACPDSFGNDAPPIKQRTTTPGSNASIDSQMPAREAQGSRRRRPRAHTNAANIHRTAPHPDSLLLPTRAVRLRRMHASWEQAQVSGAVAHCGRVLVQSVVFRDAQQTTTPRPDFVCQGLDPAANEAWRRTAHDRGGSRTGHTGWQFGCVCVPGWCMRLSRCRDRFRARTRGYAELGTQGFRCHHLLLRSLALSPDRPKGSGYADRPPEVDHQASISSVRKPLRLQTRAQTHKHTGRARIVSDQGQQTLGAPAHICEALHKHDVCILLAHLCVPTPAISSPWSAVHKKHQGQPGGLHACGQGAEGHHLLAV